MRSPLRLFFALWPDDSVRKTIRRACGEAIRRSGGRPVPFDNLHLTLAFLGSVDDSALPRVLAGAEKVVFRPFTLGLDRIGYFPRARSLWVGPSDHPPALRTLNDGLWQALSDQGFEREAKPFRPHVTLARKSRAVELEDIPLIHWSVNGFVLAESETNPKGARYRVIHEWR